MARTQVQTELIATNAISGTIIADNAITAVHIATNSISGVLVQDSGITTTMIAANNVTAAKIVTGAVANRHLASTVISSQSAVTAASGDYVLIGDTSDSNNLKKALVSDFAQNEESPTFTGNVQVDGTLGVTGATTLGTTRVNADFTVGAASGEDKAVIAPQSAGSGVIISSLNNAGSAYEPYRVDAENFSFRPSGTEVLGLTASDASFSAHILAKGGHEVRAYRSGDSAYASMFMDTGENLYIRNSWGTKDLVFDRDGNLGIGESNPDAPLHITSATPIIVFDESDASQEYRIGSFGGAYAVYDATDSAYRLIIDGNGKVGIGDTSPDNTLHVNSAGANVVAKFESTDGTGAIMLADNGGNVEIAAIGNDFHVMNAGSAAKMVVLNSGNVGIGTASPAYLTEIASNSSTSYAIGTMPTANLSIVNKNGSDGSGANNYASLYLQVADGATSRATISLVRTGDNAGDMTFGLRHASGGSGFNEKMRITSAGNVGIGTTSPGSYTSIQSNLEVKTSGHGGIAINVGATSLGMLAFVQNGTHSWSLEAENSATPFFGFNEAGTYRMIIDAGGNVGIGPNQSPENQLHVHKNGSNDVGIQISNGDRDYTWGIDTSDSSSLKLSRHAGLGNYDLVKFHPTTYLATFVSGISMNNETAAANTLDDYEEGTWTPTIYGDTTAGSTSGGTIGGTYTKIGNMVIAAFSFLDITVASAAGVLKIGGFPFTAQGPNNREQMGIARMYKFDFHTGSSARDPLPSLADNGTSALFVQSRDSTTWDIMNVTNSSNLYMEGSITYMT